MCLLWQCLRRKHSWNVHSSSSLIKRTFLPAVFSLSRGRNDFFSSPDLRKWFKERQRDREKRKENRLISLIAISRCGMTASVSGNICISVCAWKPSRCAYMEVLQGYPFINSCVRILRTECIPIMAYYVENVLWSSGNVAHWLLYANTTLLRAVGPDKNAR